MAARAVHEPSSSTANIKNAKTLEEIFRFVAKYEPHLNHIHLSAFWNNLGHLSRSSEKSWLDEHAKVLESLAKRTAHVVSSSTEIRARELANIVHGVAKSGQGTTMDELMSALATSIGQRLSDCNAQELANIAWAFAKAGKLDGTFCSAGTGGGAASASFRVSSPIQRGPLRPPVTPTRLVHGVGTRDRAAAGRL